LATGTISVWMFFVSLPAIAWFSLPTIVD
jgi:hypothetical protein